MGFVDHGTGGHHHRPKGNKFVEVSMASVMAHTFVHPPSIPIFLFRSDFIPIHFDSLSSFRSTSSLIA